MFKRLRASRDEDLASFANTELHENEVLCVNVFLLTFLHWDGGGGRTDLDQTRTDLSWPKTFAQGTKQSPNQTLVSVQKKGRKGEGGWG